MTAVRIQYLNRLILLATAPFLGIAVWMVWTSWLTTAGAAADPGLSSGVDIEAASAASTEAAAAVSDGLDKAEALAAQTTKTIEKSAQIYRLANADMNIMVRRAANYATRPLRIYDRRITRKIGIPSKQVQSNKLTAQLFYVKAQNFTGYAMKVKLKSDNAMRMVLGYDKVGKAETTLSAARRYKAVAGVNAGGYADDGGKRYPLSTTVLGGRYIGGFQPSYKDLFFVGMNKDMKLIGGKYKSRDQLDKQEPKFGASFVPVLMKDGRRQPIPPKWQKTPYRAPRTVIANYRDDQLLFIVTDGYNENGRSGATLKEMQMLLERFGVKDAYNLDGGGSSSLIFNGRVVNKPSDGRLRGLATHFLFFK